MSKKREWVKNRAVLKATCSAPYSGTAHLATSNIAGGKS